MPTVVEIIKRWNPEIEKYLERKFEEVYSRQTTYTTTETSTY